MAGDVIDHGAVGLDTVLIQLGLGQAGILQHQIEHADQLQIRGLALVGAEARG